MTNGAAFFGISENEANFWRYTEIFGNVSPEIPVPFDFPLGISGIFGKTVSFSEIQHFPGFCELATVAHNCDGSLFTHGKIDINFATVKSISSQQNHFNSLQTTFHRDKVILANLLT